MNSMNRLNFVKNFKAYTLRMKDRRKQNMAILRAYFKKQRSIIVQNTQRRIIRGTLWVGLLSVSYYVAHKIYSQKLEVERMQKKLLQLYPTISTKIKTQTNDQVYYVVPQYQDQLANIIQMCWKFHYKVIVNSDQMEPHMMDQHINKLLIDIPETVRGKCVMVNLKKLKKIQIDQLNGIIKVQSGITCKQFNQQLVKNGYQAIFPVQIQQSQKQTIYNAVVNNYPTNFGSITNSIVNLDIVSSQGQYFRSSNQNNQYGSTPNLNNIFIGTGGIFGLPLKTSFKLTKRNSRKQNKQHVFQIKSNDLNQKLLITRKFNQIVSRNQDFFNFQIFNPDQNSQSVFINLKFNKKNNNQSISNLLNQIKAEVPSIDQIQKNSTNNLASKEVGFFNIYFNTNQIGFQKFLLFKQKQSKQQDERLNKNIFYSFQNNLLKINCLNQPLLIQLISELCSQNAVIVWCKDHKFLKQIKKMTDQSEVGSQLMKIMVQIRQGIDHKKIYYTHNRYQDYFAKGTFRKLTQVFW